MRTDLVSPMCTIAVLTESVRAIENRCKKAQARLFLALLFAPLLDGWLRFFLAVLLGLVDLKVSLSIMS